MTNPHHQSTAWWSTAPHMREQDMRTVPIAEHDDEQTRFLTLFFLSKSTYTFTDRAEWINGLNLSHTWPSLYNMVYSMLLTSLLLIFLSNFLYSWNTYFQFLHNFFEFSQCLSVKLSTVHLRSHIPRWSLDCCHVLVYFLLDACLYQISACGQVFDFGEW